VGSKRILIIDDERGILDEVKDYLEEEGFCVETAEDGTKGLRLLESFRPHVMILDLKLPDISGMEILRKSRQSFPGVRVIVSTGYVDPVLIDEAEALGRDAYLQKPFNLEVLKMEIDRLFV
jgi:DNA-binding response OmpR family regulator